MVWNKERKESLLAVTIITVLLIVCKVFGILALSWVWVFSPIWLAGIATLILKVWFEVFIMERW